MVVPFNIRKLCLQGLIKKTPRDYGSTIKNVGYNLKVNRNIDHSCWRKMDMSPEHSRCWSQAETTKWIDKVRPTRCKLLVPNKERITVIGMYKYPTIRQPSRKAYFVFLPSMMYSKSFCRRWGKVLHIVFPYNDIKYLISSVFLARTIVWFIL